MKKLRKFNLVVCAALFPIVLLGGNCTVSISANPGLAICQGETTRLTASASGSGTIGYVWTGGSTNQFIDVTTSGTYTVTITDDTSCTVTNWVIVTVHPLPTPTISITQNADTCAQISVGFTVSSSTNDTSYSWNFGDPSSGPRNFALGQSVSHEFSPTGSDSTYSVTVTAISEHGCSTSTTKQVQIWATPEFVVEDLTIDVDLPFKICFPSNSPVTFHDFTFGVDSIAGQIDEYYWDWDGISPIDFTTQSESETADHTYNIGIHHLTVTALNSQNGCIGRATNNTTVIFQKEAVASMLIDTNTVTICEGNEVLIYNNSVNADTCIWDWKDGTTTTDVCSASQTHEYNFTSQYVCNHITQNGRVSYKVLLTAKNGCNSHTNESPVYVRPRPRAGFTAPDTICIISDSVGVSFTNNSCPSFTTGGAAVTYSWNFGDGGASTLRNPIHFYHRPGTYNVLLIVSNTPSNPVFPSCGADTISKTICIDTLPEAEFNLNLIQSCVGSASGLLVATTNLTDTTFFCRNLSFLWDVAPRPGTPSTGWRFQPPDDRFSFSPKIRFTEAGIYDVILHVRHSCGNSTVTHTITITDDPDINITPPPSYCGALPYESTFCVPSDYDPNGSQITSYSWSVSCSGCSGNCWTFITPPTDACPRISFNCEGTYSITVTADNACPGISTKTFDFIIRPRPTIVTGSINPSNTICSQTTVQIYIDTINSTAGFFSWSPAVTCLTSDCDTVTVAPTTTTTYTVTGYYNASGGCSTADDVTITVTQPPQPVICNIPDVCRDALPFQMCPGLTGGTWGGPGIVDPVTGMFAPGAANCGANGVTYTVAVAGCNATATATANVHCSTVSITPANPSICQGGSVTLAATPGGIAYSWNTSPAETTQVITVSPTVTTGYTVTVTFGSCTATASATVTVNALPTTLITPASSTICEGDSVMLTANSGNGYNYRWSTNETTISIVVSPSTTTPYDVTVTDGNGCTASALATINVNLKPILTLTADKLGFCRGYGPATIEANYNSNDPTLILSWSANACPSFSCGASVIVNPAITTEYFATVTNSFSCSISDSITITVNDTPVASMIFYPDTCVNQVIHFRDDSSLPGTYSWNFGDGNTSTLEHPTYTYTNPGNYTITHTVTTGPGCSDDTVYQFLHVKDPPVANFRLDTDSGCGPLTVTFKDTSTGPDLVFDWTFLNLETGGVVFDSTDSSTGIYSFPFTFPAVQGDTIRYEIILEVTNPCGSDIKKDTVTVFSRPVASFAISPTSGCDSLEVFFINSSISADSFVWTRDTTGGNPETLNIAYQTDSAFFRSLFSYKITDWNITLTATNGCGSDDSVQQVHVLPPAVTSFFSIIGSTERCQFTEITICDGSTGASLIDYNWGDGTTNTSPIGACITHVYSNTGSFDVCQHADGCGYDVSCQQITVLSAPRVSFTADSLHCVNNPIDFTNTSPDMASITSFIWDFGTGDSSGVINSTHTYATSDTFTIILTGNDSSTTCKGYDTLDIFIHPLPSVVFAPKDTSGCEPLALAFSLTQPDPQNGLYQWTFIPEVGLPVDTLALTTVYYTFSADTYNIKLKAVSVEGCSDSAYTGLRVYPKPVSLIGIANADSCDVPITVDYVNRSTGGIRDVLWEHSELDSLWNKDTVTVTYFEEGYDSISLIVLNDYRCSDTSDYPFHAIDIPEVSFNFNPAIGCERLCVVFHLDSNNATSYLWHFGDLTTGTDQNPQHCYSAGQYTVRVELTYENGICFDTVEIPNAVLVHPTPVADFYFEKDPTPLTYDGSYIFFNTSDSSDSFTWDYDWHDGDYPDAVKITDTVTTYRYYENREFFVRLISSNEFCADTFIAALLPDFLGGLFVPNAFMPANPVRDDVNVFKPVGVGLAEYKIEIYSPAGTLLWESGKIENGMPAEGWDGTYNGRLMQQDAYVWKVRAIFEDGRVWQGMPNKNGRLYRIGTVTLIR